MMRLPKKLQREHGARERSAEHGTEAASNPADKTKVTFPALLTKMRNISRTPAAIAAPICTAVALPPRRADRKDV